jgi:tetratricopeptide (TPR) repeat protein
MKKRPYAHALSQIPGKVQQANALHQRGQLESARILYEEILKIQPMHFDALHLLGVIAAQSKNPEKAADLIAKAIKINPNHAATYCNRATALQELNQFDAAVDSYDKAIALKPDYALAHCNRGNVLKALRRFEAALASYDRAIALKDDFPEAYSNRGNVLQELRQFEAALANYDKAIAIKADYAEAYFNRGCLLKQLGQFAAALASFDQAIAIKADYAEAHVNRGVMLKELHRLEEALASYNRAIAIKRDFAEAYVNRSTALLLRGDLERGWLDYEWRRKRDSGLSVREERHFRQPLWVGESSIAGKTILLHSEQGLGDTLQFCRYAKLVSDLGARVILEAQAPLTSLLACLEGVSRVVARGDFLPDFDCHCPLLSLPLAFRTTLQTISAETPYLRSDPVKIARWQARLGGRTRPRIGLAWSGNPKQTHDLRRSVRLAEWIPHLPAEFQFFSLQNAVRDTDRKALLDNPDIANFTDELNDFADTAAFCECMDLVISVDTSVAHLSAALGKQTWVLLSFNPDWRWLLERDDSPWYPTAKLYRQRSLGEWSEVFERVRAELTRTFDRRSHRVRWPP